MAAHEVAGDAAAVHGVGPTGVGGDRCCSVLLELELVGGDVDGVGGVLKEDQSSNSCDIINRALA